MLTRQIRLRKVDEYIIQTSIASNPHKEAEAQKKFIEDLIDQRRSLRPEPELPETLDVETFNRFRKDLVGDSNLIKVK